MARKLLIYYYAAFVLAVLAATLGYFCNTRGWWAITPQTVANRVTYSFLILYVIISTPLVLKYFARLVTKYRTLPMELREHKYKQLVVARLAIVALGLVASLLFYYVLQEKSLLWLAGISAVALYFCKPTQNKVDSDLQDEQNEQEPQEEPKI